MNSKCGTCASQNITYYKQRRKDGVWVVTARCENGHHPIKGKPFYSVSDFDVESLPDLNSAPQDTQPDQYQLFNEKFFDDDAKARQIDLIEFLEEKKYNKQDLFPNPKRNPS